MENNIVVLQKIQNYCTSQQFHFWVYIPKNWKQGLKEIAVLLIVIALFTNSQGGSSPKAHLWVNGWSKCIHCNRIFSLKKEEISNICYNMHNLEDLMLSETGQPLKDKCVWFHLYKVLREKLNWEKIECQGAGGGVDKRELLVSGYTMSVLQSRKSSGD